MGYANAKQELIIPQILALAVVEDAKNVQMEQSAKHVMQKLIIPTITMLVSVMNLIMLKMMELTVHALQDIMINRTYVYNVL